MSGHWALGRDKCEIVSQVQAQQTLICNDDSRDPHEEARR
jgi:hypothetical protein